MIRRRTKKLIHRYLEGNISPKDKQKLHDLMPENPEISTFIEEMMALETSLHEAARQQPRIDLVEPIMQSVREKEKISPVHQQMRDHHTYSHTLVKVVGQLFPSHPWNLAYSFIAGLIIGIIIFGVVSRQERAISFTEWEVSGSMVDKHAVEIAVVPVILPALEANIKAYRLPQDFTQVIVEVTSETSSLINISFRSSGFQVWSLKSVESKPDCHIMAGYSSIEIGNLGGNTYLILMKKLTDMEEELIVSIYTDGHLDYTTRLPIE